MKTVPFIFSVACILLLNACLPEDFFVIYHNPSQQPDYLDYMERVKAQPLEFQIPVREDAAAWARAHYIFKSRNGKLHGSHKFRISTDKILEIAVSKGSINIYEDVSFLYRVVRASGREMVNYKLSYASYSKEFSFLSPLERYHAKVIAYYIVSGKLDKRANYEDSERLK